MTPESNALNLAQSAFEAVCKERDEALAKLSTVRRWVEKNLSGGFVDSLTHLQNLESVADDWYGRLVETIRERDEARDQLKAMRDELEKVCQQRDAWATRCDKVGVTAMQEAIKVAYGAMQTSAFVMQNIFPAPAHLGPCGPESCCDASCMEAVALAGMLERNNAALAKLQPFIKP
jgi:hypothetical protein